MSIITNTSHYKSDNVMDLITEIGERRLGRAVLVDKSKEWLEELNREVCSIIEPYIPFAFRTLMWRYVWDGLPGDLPSLIRWEFSDEYHAKFEGVGHDAMVAAFLALPVGDGFK